LLLPLLQGGELFSILQANHGVEKESAVFYGACIVDALDYLHQRYISHRDLKPENVLLDGDGYGILVDFGFAKIVADKTFTFCGTPEYLAPEIIMAKGHNGGVDYWAFGVLLYEMLLGESPFFANDQKTMFKKIVMMDYSFPDDFDPDAKDLVSKLLVRHRGQRLGSLANGAKDITRHPFFDTMDWKKLSRKEIEAPWVPEVKDPFDARHFEKIRDTGGNYGRHLSPQEQELFKEF